MNCCVHATSDVPADVYFGGLFVVGTSVPPAAVAPPAPSRSRIFVVSYRRPSLSLLHFSARLSSLGICFPLSVHLVSGAPGFGNAALAGEGLGGGQ